MENAGDYVRNVEQLIQTEGDRTQQYLDPSTKAEIDKLIDEQLIEKHMDTVVSMPIGGVVSLIQGRNFTGKSCTRRSNYYLEVQIFRLF